MNRKPNVVIIYADDLGYGDLGCFGAADMATPHLDTLAAEGVRFTNWYSNAPVCSPSRASLLTGRYPGRTGVNNILGGRRGTPGLPVDQVTLAGMLKNHGYRTGLFGKWHLGVTPEHGPNAHGFDEFFGFLAGCVDYYSHIYYWGQGGGVNPSHDLWRNGREVWRNGRYLTELITEGATDFIDACGDEPFFLYVPYNAPHYPMHAPQEYLDRFPGLPPDRRIMAAMVAAMDDGVGGIMRALRSAGVYDDTLVFFSSDNGPSSESRNFLDGREDLYYGGTAGKLRGHKGSLFDGGIREPAIMSYPRRIPAAQVCDEVGVMMDVVPTILSLTGCGLSADHGVDGLDLSDVLTAEGKSPHGEVFWEYGKQAAVRDNNWKLVLNGKLDFGRVAGESLHLSDMSVDPGEQVNLSGEFPEIVERLLQKLESWQAALER